MEWHGLCRRRRWALLRRNCGDVCSGQMFGRSGAQPRRRSCLRRHLILRSSEGHHPSILYHFPSILSPFPSILNHSPSLIVIHPPFLSTTFNDLVMPFGCVLQRRKSLRIVDYNLCQSIYDAGKTLCCGIMPQQKVSFIANVYQCLTLLDPGLGSNCLVHQQSCPAQAQAH